MRALALLAGALPTAVTRQRHYKIGPTSSSNSGMRAESKHAVKYNETVVEISPIKMAVL